MIKHNDSLAASVNVLAETELDQVVGGCSHGRRKGWGGWGHGYGHGKRDYDKSYDKGGYDSSSYEPSYDEGYDDSGSSVQVNDQNIELNITINQVAG